MLRIIYLVWVDFPMWVFDHYCSSLSHNISHWMYSVSPNSFRIVMVDGRVCGMIRYIYWEIQFFFFLLDFYVFDCLWFVIWFGIRFFVLSVVSFVVRCGRDRSLLWWREKKGQTLKIKEEIFDEISRTSIVYSKMYVILFSVCYSIESKGEN